jgi:hypothetical protein
MKEKDSSFFRERQTDILVGLGFLIIAGLLLVMGVSFFPVIGVLLAMPLLALAVREFRRRA